MGDETDNSDSDSDNNSYLAQWGRDPNVSYEFDPNPFTGISGYNADAFGGTPKPMIGSETPGAEGYIPGINSSAFTSQGGTSQGADYTYGSAGQSSGIDTLLKQITTALGKKTKTLEGFSDLGQALLAFWAATQGKTKPEIAGYKGGVNMAMKAVQPTNVAATRAYGAPVMGQAYKATTYAAEGGIMGLARGGTAKPPRYLDGPTDGMADKINTDIDGKQPAKLSHGEFVIPADVVSHLGNGNSKAGADVLYKMMDRVRKARTGTKKQGKQINPAKFTPGGIAGYAGGGAVAFSDGGAAATPAPPPPPIGATATSNLSEWAGPYVTDMLGKANALANQPYQAYTGQLTAGTSPLQQQAFDAYRGLNTQYSPVAGTFTAQNAQQYMNPYLSATLDPQLSELNRQNQITQMGQQAKLAQAGGFGGSRDAIMRAENARNLGQQQSNLINTAYSQAFDKAMGQFNTEQQNKMREAEFGAKYGIDALNAQMAAGAQQRGIESENVAAEKAAFEQARAYPYEQLKFQKSMLSGLPISTQSTLPATSQYDDIRAALAAIFGPLGTNA